MKFPFALISDIHSNVEALDAVLRDIADAGIGRVLCLGDIVGYGPGARDCVLRVREEGFACLLGNHDDAAADPRARLSDFHEAAAAGIRIARARLSGEEKAWLLALPKAVSISGMQFSHASLAETEEDEWPYVLNPFDAALHFGAQVAPLAFCGHTHTPAVWIEVSPQEIGHVAGSGIMRLPEKERCLVNVGSVGQPRDGDPRACYVIVRESRLVEFRRVEYDIEAAAEKILKAGLPRHNAERLREGL